MPSKQEALSLNPQPHTHTHTHIKLKLICTWTIMNQREKINWGWGGCWGGEFCQDICKHGEASQWNPFVQLIYANKTRRYWKYISIKSSFVLFCFL
jgi:hypothetical protein